MRGHQLLAIFLSLGLLTLSGWAWAATGPGSEFSANQVMIGPGGGQERGPIYCQKDRWRVELTQQGKAMILIYRLDKKVVWTMVPEDKVYLERPLFPDEVPWGDKVPGESERKLLGEEAVQGHPALKYQVKSWNGETAQEFYLWVSKELQVPIKTATLDGAFGTELTDIKMGPQPNDLFEVPPDFRLISPPPHG